MSSTATYDSVIEIGIDSPSPEAINSIVETNRETPKPTSAKTLPKSKAAKEAYFKSLYDNAMTACREAGNGHTPQPMTVTGMGQRYFVSEGLCGFAWVTVRPAFSPFAKWLKKNKYADNGWNGGMTIWISDFGQSYERKMAGARAAAEVLRSAGIQAYSDGRLD